MTIKLLRISVMLKFEEFSIAIIAFDIKVLIMKSSNIQ